MLRHVPQVTDPNVLVDASTRDDAAVYRLSPERALVATTDFFTPIVDDAATWGAIAAESIDSRSPRPGGIESDSIECGLPSILLYTSRRPSKSHRRSRATTIN